MKYRKEKLSALKIGSTIWKIDKEDIIAYYEECLREKKIYDKVHRIHLRNGKVKTIHRKAEFVFDEKGNAVKMIGTTQDITDEFRVQQELRESQMFIRKITDATPSIIASYNVNTGNMFSSAKDWKSFWVIAQMR